MIIRYSILLTIYTLCLGVFHSSCFGADETVLSINGHQCDDDDDEAYEGDEEDEKQERLRGLWSDFPSEFVHEKLVGLLEEDIAAKASESTLKSKCLLNDSVPLRINNVSDLNVLIETEEPNLGKIRRIKRIVKSGEEGFYCAPFKRRIRVVISTEAKSKRDNSIIDGKAQLKAIDGKLHNLDNDDTKNLATRVALKDHQNAKLQRV